MKIDFYKNVKPVKVDKTRLFRTAFKEAVHEIVMEYTDKSYTTVYKNLLTKAKKKLGYQS